MVGRGEMLIKWRTVTHDIVCSIILSLYLSLSENVRIRLHDDDELICTRNRRSLDSLLNYWLIGRWSTTSSALLITNVTPFHSTHFLKFAEPNGCFVAASIASLKTAYFCRLPFNQYPTDYGEIRLGRINQRPLSFALFIVVFHPAARNACCIVAPQSLAPVSKAVDHPFRPSSPHIMTSTVYRAIGVSNTFSFFFKSIDEMILGFKMGVDANTDTRAEPNNN